MSNTILIIDDDPLIRLIIEKMMRKVNPTLTFVPCRDGKVALEKLSKHKGNCSDLIILLDLNMPVIDGWGFLEAIQSSQFNDYQDIKLFILSSSIDKVDTERARQFSIVKKFYHKPLSRLHIREILNVDIDKK